MIDDEWVVFGSFSTPYGDMVGRLTIGILRDLKEALTTLLLAPDSHMRRPAVERTLSAYTDALERVLGARAGSLVFVEPAQLDEWFDALAHQQNDPDNRVSEEERTWHNATV